MDKIHSDLPIKCEPSEAVTPVWAETLSKSFHINTTSTGGTPNAGGGSGHLQGAHTISGAGGTEPNGDAAVVTSAYSISDTEKCKKKRHSAAQKRNEQIQKLSATSEKTSNEAAERKRKIDDEVNAGDPKLSKTQGPIGVSIVAEDVSKNITPDMVHPIRTALWEMLENTPDPLPVINAGTFKVGVLHFLCEDIASAEWLHGLNGKIIKDIKLKVVSSIDFTKPPVKMAWKSKNMWCMDISKVLDMVQRFNPSLNTKDWRVVNTVAKKNFVRRIVFMDEESADYIKARGYCLQTGMEESNFKLVEPRIGKLWNSELMAVSTISHTDVSSMLDIWEDM